MSDRIGHFQLNSTDIWMDSFAFMYMALVGTVLSIFFSCDPQKGTIGDYDQLIWKGMLSYNDSLYSKSLGYFSKAFKIVDYDSPTHYFYAAAAAIRTNKDSLAHELLVHSIRKNKASYSYFLSFEEFVEFKNHWVINSIKTDFNKHLDQYWESNGASIEKEIEVLLQRDQDVRAPPLDYEKMRSVDSLNITQLIEIVESKGWHKRAWILLWHHRGSYEEKNYVWNYFRPFINRKISEGKIRKSFWAIFDDEKSIRNNGTQIFGSYHTQYEEYPIQDILNVDKKRSEIDLPPYGICTGSITILYLKDTHFRINPFNWQLIDEDFIKKLG